MPIMKSQSRLDMLWEASDASRTPIISTLSHSRQTLYHMFESVKFKLAIATVITMNTMLVVHETNMEAICDRVRGRPVHCDHNHKELWIAVANWVFLALYSAEMVFRIHVFRVKYFLNHVDLFDAFVVIVGIAGETFGNIVPGLAVLRLFRVARVMRALRITTICAEAKLFLQGLQSACKAIAVGSVLIALFTFLWSIAAVIFVNPVNQKLVNEAFYDDSGCDRCPIAYETVTSCMLTFLQIVIMQDNWGEYTIPIIVRQPMTAVIFVGAAFTITLMLTNLILAVIVEKALETREIKLNKVAGEHKLEMDTAREHFVNLCRVLDVDCDGNLTYQELMDGFETDHFNDVLTVLDIERSDMDGVFHMMDTDKSGTISYDEFSYQLQNLKSQDMHTMVAFIKFYVSELHSFQIAFNDNNSSKTISPCRDQPSKRLTHDTTSCGVGHDELQGASGAGDGQIPRAHLSTPLFPMIMQASPPECVACHGGGCSVCQMNDVKFPVLDVEPQLQELLKAHVSACRQVIVDQTRRFQESVIRELELRECLVTAAVIAASAELALVWPVVRHDESAAFSAAGFSRLVHSPGSKVGVEGKMYL